MAQPRKRFGQNFLKNEHIIDQMVMAVSPKLGEHLVEIGPGQGALTQPLVNVVEKMDAVEIDRDLILLLEEQFAEQLRIHSADVLKFDFNDLIQEYGDIRVVGNLPYNISTQLMFHLLNYSNSVSDMHFLLQKEVVDRLAASPNTKNYGRLSVVIQYHCQVQPLFLVPPESFYPVPKVMSQFVRLVPKKEKLPLKDLDLFKKVVTQSFSMRRKTLRNNLKDTINDDALERLGISPSARAETLTLEQFVDLANAVFEQ